VANTLAYCGMVKVAAVKFCIVKTPGPVLKTLQVLLSGAKIYVKCFKKQFWCRFSLLQYYLLFV